MKLKKRMISLLLALALLVCIVPPTDTTAHAAVSAQELVDYARQYIGYPYVKGGTGPKSFDCSGFVSYVFKHFGIELPKGASNYFNNPTKYGKVVGKGSIENAQMGDIIAWSGHVAIYTEDGYCVEALGTKYGVIERIKVNRHKSNGMNYKVIRVNGVVNLKTPKISTLTGNDSGIEVKWNKIADAQKYRVFRKVSDGSWKKLADTASVSYVDKSVKAGTKYTYTVCCISKDGKIETSKYDTAGKSITYTAAPKLSAVSNAAAGVKISWSKVTGAAKYRVFYKANNDTTWHKAGDTASTSYTWKAAKSGTKYKFTVRCITSDGKFYSGSYDKAGISINYIAAPKLTSVSAENYGTLIKWNKVAGAESYRVFYKTASGGWTKIADTTDISYVWTGAKVGTSYTFTVRCISSDGKNYTSAYDSAGKSLTPVNTPKLTAISNTVSGVKLSWGKVSGAAKYRVFYKAGNDSKWHKAGDTANTEFTLENAESGTEYKFTVRALSKDGKAYTSGYDIDGLGITYFEAPQLTGVIADGSKTVIRWNKVSGAESYRVFRRVKGGSWEKLADTAAASYTDTAKAGSEYYYTVRCISGDGKSYISSYRAGVIAAEKPVVTSLSKTENGISISWDKVPGAAKYRVFYKANGESTWHKAGDTTKTSYTWTKAKSGNKYSFTVRCISSDGATYASGYNDKGKSINYVAAPQISSLTKSSSGIQIKWGKVAGAEKYRVFYKVNGEKTWHIAGDTTKTSYTWKNAKRGVKYSFTVRCISKNGKTYTSAFNEKGKSITK